MKKILFLFFFIIFASLAIIKIPYSKADSTSCDISNVQSVCGGTNGYGSACSDLLNQCESSINQALQDSIKATAPLQSKLDSINSQIQGIKNEVAQIEANLAGKKQDIDTGYKDLAKQQTILDATIRDYYIKSSYNSPLLLLLSTNSVSQFTQILGYQKAQADRDKGIITSIAFAIKSLQNSKNDLEAQESQLNSLQTNLDNQSAQLDKIVSGATAYQSTLSNQLSSLNSIQQNILNSRLSGLNIPLFASSGGSCSSDIGKDPGFGTKFGFFTYGVPNRVGLSQYGAWGRAKAGQDYNQILQAYYNYDSISGVDTNTQISVTGYGSYSLEDYVRRIYEVPDSWTDNNLAALKAQAIAARSYVMAATSNGANPICATDQCQVFKPDAKGGNWEQAVDATAGQVMMQGGNPIKAWFSSTHGGYVHSSSDIGWSGTSFTKNAVDNPSGSNGSFSDVQSNSYDKDSPWFYCDWGSRSENNSTAWLKPEEVADIVNVLLLAQKDSSVVNHLYQTDKPNPAGTDTWDASRVKQELSSRGGSPFNSVSSISVSADFGSGKVSSVNVSGDGGSVSFSGSDFKNYFDLRAPANIQIVGPLYNVER